MRSLSTEFPRISPASPLPVPGRYKSCRRSTGELFSKEQLQQEEELRRCAQLEIAMRVEQQRQQDQQQQEQQGGVKDQEGGVKDEQEASTPAKNGSEGVLSPPKLTPLKWRSASAKNLNITELNVEASPLPAPTADLAPQTTPGPAQGAAAESPIAPEGAKEGGPQSQSAMRTTNITPTMTSRDGVMQSHPQSQSQAAVRPSQAQLRAQVMNSLSLDKHIGNQTVTGRDRFANGVVGALNPVQNGSNENVALKQEQQQQQQQEQQGGLNSATSAERSNGMQGRELFPGKEQHQQSANTPSAIPRGALETLTPNQADRNVPEGAAISNSLAKEKLMGGAGPKVNQAAGGLEAHSNGPLNPMESKAEEPTLAEQSDGKSSNGDPPAVAATDPAAPPERVVTPEIREAAPPSAATVSNGGAKAAQKLAAEPVVEMDFKPVDLDKKYRDQELVRHYTAAKIQNREEALLNNPSPPGATNVRKAPVGEEPAAMTIEFLRARLQAERSASKTTKARMEQLAKKVTDLENKLAAETELRKTAETSLQDAQAKLKKATPALEQQQGLQKQPSIGVPPTLAPTRTAGDTVVAKDGEKPTSAAPSGDIKEEKTVSREGPDGGELQQQQTVLRVDNNDAEKTVSRDDVQKNSEESAGEKTVTGSESGLSTAAGAPSSAQNVGGLWMNRSVVVPKAGQSDQDKPSQPTKTEGSVKRETKASGGESSGPGSSPERATISRPETRAAIEDRLRTMWDRIREDMEALADAKGDQAGKKDGSGGEWVNQLPFVLQKSASARDSGSAAATDNAPSRSVSSGSGQAEEAAPNVSAKASFAAEKRNSFKRNASLAKNVAKLVEQFELQETAQREWEESFESRQAQEQDEGEPPSLVTGDGEVVGDGLASDSRTTHGEGAAITRTQSQGERKSDANGGPLSRSKSLGFLPSQKKSGKLPRKGSMGGGRVEFRDEDQLIGDSGGDDDELVYDPETEVAEELPNGIYLHHSRAEVGNSFSRAGVRESPRRRRMSSERGGSGGGRQGINSPSMADRAQSRERLSRSDMHSGMQDRAARDMYFESGRGGMKGSGPPYPSERDYHQHRGMGMPPEGAQDDMMYRGYDRRGGPDGHYPPSHTSDDGMGGMGYREKDHLDQQDLPYRSPGGHRNAMWHDGDGDIRYAGRGMGSGGHGGFHPAYGMNEHPHQGMYADAPPVYRDMPYGAAGGQGRSDYFTHGGGGGMVPPTGLRTGPMNGFSMHGPERGATQPPTQFFPTWETAHTIEEKPMPVRVMEEVPAAPAATATSAPNGQAGGEANEVLKALRIAKQQIKSATNVGDHQAASAAIMTAQYTVSQEHRIGAGGQVSKTSYTVEAPVYNSRVTKTVHEGWHLDATKPTFKKRGVFNGSNGVALDLTGANVTDIISGGAPLSGESSYVEKLNVGRGIQFFFSG